MLTDTDTIEPTAECNIHVGAAEKDGAFHPAIVLVDVDGRADQSRTLVFEGRTFGSEEAAVEEAVRIAKELMAQT